MKAAPFLSALALAACGSGPTVTAQNASVAEVKEKIRAAGEQQVFLTPGRWESAMTVTSLDVPGMPAELAQRIKQSMAGKVAATCLTPEQAKKPAAEFFAGKDRKGCKYDRFAMGNGTLDAKMLCGGGDSSATITLKGSYQPETFRMVMTLDGTGVPKAPQGAMAMAMTVESRRTGVCTGKES